MSQEEEEGMSSPLLPPCSEWILIQQCRFNHEDEACSFCASRNIECGPKTYTDLGERRRTNPQTYPPPPPPVQNNYPQHLPAPPFPQPVYLQPPPPHSPLSQIILFLEAQHPNEGRQLIYERARAYVYPDEQDQDMDAPDYI